MTNKSFTADHAPNVKRRVGYSMETASGLMSKIKIVGKVHGQWHFRHSSWVVRDFVEIMP